MTTTVNSTDCHGILNSTSQTVNLSVYGATTSIGAISSLAAVVIILVAKGYKEFVYRLLLTAVLCNGAYGHIDTPQIFFRPAWIRIATALPFF